MSSAIPITLLTGYLGSGKTTLLSGLLGHPELKNTVVLVNEFGEIALDHELLYSASGESIVLLGSGCLCCALRNDLSEQLDDLYTRRLRGEIPPFERVIIETTGLADPAPILQTLVAEPMLAALYRLDGVVTTADGQFGGRQLDAHFESVKQAALADRIIITKADLADEAALSALAARLRRINPAAPMIRCANGRIDPGFVLAGGLHAVAGEPARVRDWLHAERYLALPPGTPRDPGPRARHDQRIRSFALAFEAPVSGARLWAGLEALIEASGDKLLRVKGIVNALGQSQPKVVHIVQHVLYPVVTLAEWPSEDRRTRLVFIVRDLDEAQVQAQLDSALTAA